MYIFFDPFFFNHNLTICCVIKHKDSFSFFLELLDDVSGQGIINFGQLMLRWKYERQRSAVIRISRYLTEQWNLYCILNVIINT